jgi:excisionase family DNA binding protein
MAGCTGLEPVASGVTGSEEGVAGTRNSSQPSGIPGNRSARSTDFCPGLGRLFRRRVTPGLQSVRSEEVMWQRLLSVREAAGLLGVCTSTVYKLCAEGKLRHVRVSNAIRISEAALRGYG